MPRIRTILAAVAVFATIFAPAPSKAAGRTIDIEIFGSTISPRQIVAEKGDQLRFTVTDGHHDIDTHKSADFDGDPATDPTLIQSGDVRTDRSKAPIVFTTGFTGGTVWYRCTIHSTFDVANGICAIMCASITDRTAIPTPPTITVPGTPIRERPASISGTADPLTIVVLAEGQTVETGQNRGQAMTNEYGEWTVKTVDFGQTGGNKQLIARSVDARGYVSADSAPAIIQYLPDFSPPELTWNPIGFPAVFPQEMVLSGTAKDNIKIRSIAVRFTFVNPAVSPTGQVSAQSSYTFPATTCTGCGTASTVSWEWRGSLVGTLGIPGGVFQVVATAFDTSNLFTPVGAPTFQNLVVQLAGPAPTASPVATLSPGPLTSGLPVPTISPVPPTFAPQS